MSSVGDAFIKFYGKPDPLLPCRLKFEESWKQGMVDFIVAEIGSGVYSNGFYHLLGEDLVSLDPLLETWRFILPDDKPRNVVGRNAYGVLLVAEDLQAKGMGAQLCVLDPIRVGYHRDENWLVTNGLVTWLPKYCPNFTDQRIYRAMVGDSNVRLETDDILAIKTPTSLGGELGSDNFQIENIHDYFASTAAIYAQYLAAGKLIQP